MNILWIIIAVVAYVGIAMAFYFGLTMADPVGESGVNVACAIAWPLVAIICICIGPFYGFFVFSAWVHNCVVEDGE